ncbi:hypothetical protein [Acanthopleuribacter pedis]|uniref:Uncharacterized protein n=1 Tax=Acanthopleuribacter pedis TaxID=442870 RepID=A0A8J7Q871_9BACT|nr:hypothetical protein [Acanthopleuribacter pedis]MBO1319482.1 hypothetical protein [Acanthopleuribacter pedis]
MFWFFLVLGECAHVVHNTNLRVGVGYEYPRFEVYSVDGSFKKAIGTKDASRDKEISSKANAWIVDGELWVQDLERDRTLNIEVYGEEWSYYPSYVIAGKGKSLLYKGPEALWYFGDDKKAVRIPRDGYSQENDDYFLGAHYIVDDFAFLYHYRFGLYVVDFQDEAVYHPLSTTTDQLVVLKNVLPYRDGFLVVLAQLKQRGGQLVPMYFETKFVSKSKSKPVYLDVELVSFEAGVYYFEDEEAELKPLKLNAIKIN